MTKVQRLVGVRRRILDHHKFIAVGLLTVVSVNSDSFELLDPKRWSNAHVQEALYRIVLFDDRSMIQLTDDVKEKYNDVTVVGIRIYDDECHVFAQGDLA